MAYRHRFTERKLRRARIRATRSIIRRRARRERLQTKMRS
jgi:hypothetical protein